MLIIFVGIVEHPFWYQTENHTDWYSSLCCCNRIHWLLHMWKVCNCCSQATIYITIGLARMVWSEIEQRRFTNIIINTCICRHIHTRVVEHLKLISKNVDDENVNRTNERTNVRHEMIMKWMRSSVFEWQTKSSCKFGKSETNSIRRQMTVAIMI